MLSSHQILELFLISVVTSMISSVHYVYAAAFSSINKPVINDPNLKAELIFKRLNVTTTMAFLGPNDILVLEKDTGNVLRVVNGTLASPALVHVNVASEDERGLLGVAVAKQNKSTTSSGSSTLVFLYYTLYGRCGNNGNAGASMAKTVTSVFPPPVAANCLYKYELVGNKLVNPSLLLSLPGTPGPIHNGGKILIGPDQNIYLVIGDLYYSHRTQAQNILGGPPPDGTSGILRITQDGLPVSNSPLGKTYPLNLYYAYGIRNSFGMDFDPVTGKLWDTENGPNYGDEINLVEPGHNSGWAQVQGIWTPKGAIGNENAGLLNLHPSNLVDFGGKGKYKVPEFIWFHTVAPTALKFLNSTKLGKQYQNDLFVGDYNNGNLYHFKLSQNRTALVLNGTLANKIAYTSQESKPAVFGTGFQGGITDIQVGPDGYLYVLTFFGSIYKIVPRTLS